MARRWTDFPEEYASWLLRYREQGDLTIGPLPVVACRQVRMDFYRFRNAVNLAIKQHTAEDSERFDHLMDLSEIFVSLCISIDSQPSGESQLRLFKNPLVAWSEAHGELVGGDTAESC